MPRVPRRWSRRRRLLGGDNDRILGKVRGRAVNGPFFLDCALRSTSARRPGTTAVQLKDCFSTS